ncbi:uncharacterized protein LOC143432552 [Xylocopa sonorina]|uniref:uncharacterized protein LOC143432552 n=1 Tax=Xylocopa sonorina TaxID=1818115 RepID=UPI00403AA370
MTRVRQILRCVQRLGRIQESGVKALNRSVRCASTQTQPKITEDKNGRKIFVSPFGDYTPSDTLLQEYIWKNLGDHMDRIALECAVTGRKYKYSEARDICNYVARSLRNMGLKKGDVVALIAPNYPESILAFIGMMEAELVVTTVNPIYTPYEIKRQLTSSGVKGIVTVAEIARPILGLAKETLPPGAPFVVIEDGSGTVPEGAVPFKDLITKGKSLPPVSNSGTNPDDLAVLPYSSGTTGLPKGVMLTHRNLVSNIEMTELTVVNASWLKSGPDHQEIHPLILPFFHIFGLNVVTLPQLAIGTKIVTLPKFTPELFIKLLSTHKITALYAVPPVILFLIASPHIKKQHLESMHRIMSGAAPMACADADRLYNKFGIDVNKLKMSQGYGLTETSPIVSIELTGLKPGSIGKNIAGCELRLVDPNTNEDISSPGQNGEIWVRGKHVMKGYFKNEEATKEALVEGGWLKTGDLAYYDEDMDFFVTDRLKELIKVKGFQVPPAELEALLRMHPDVLEAAVIGIPNERCGEVPKAFVVPKPGSKPKAEDIQNFVKGKVSDFKELQGGVTFVEGIPKSMTGKILRRELKEKYKS